MAVHYIEEKKKGWSTEEDERFVCLSAQTRRFTQQFVQQQQCLLLRR